MDHHVVDALIEIPLGSRNKYELDKATGRIRLDGDCRENQSVSGTEYYTSGQGSNNRLPAFPQFPVFI